MGSQYLKVDNHNNTLVDNFAEKIRSIVSTCIKNECEQLRKCLERANDEILKLKYEQRELKALFKLQLEENTKECKRLRLSVDNQQYELKAFKSLLEDNIEECKRLRLSLDICNENVSTLNSNRKKDLESSPAARVHHEQIVNEVNQQINAQTLPDHSYVNNEFLSGSFDEANDLLLKEESITIENVLIEPEYELVVSPMPSPENDDSRLSTENIDPNNLFLSPKIKKKKNSHSDKGSGAVCNMCNKRFSSINVVNTHKRRVHHGERRYDHCFQCEHCDKQYRAKFDLTHHIFTTHFSVQKPFQCSFCGKGFNKRANMKAHELIHGPKSFSCLTCGKAFSWKRNLKRHASVHKSFVPTY